MEKLPMTAGLSTANGTDRQREEPGQGTAGSYATWNSWGERNPFSMGSSGRF